MPQTKAPTIATDQMLQGIAAFILARSVPILDLDDRSNGGSGVLLRLDGRYFVVTAAHVIESDHKYAILTREFNNKYDDIVAKYTDPRHDIGILELNAKSIDRLLELGHSFLETEYLYTDRYPHAKAPIRVSGFPSDKQTRVINRRRIGRKTTVHNIAYGSLSYDTFTLPQSRWPNLSSEFRKCHRLNDIFCSWDPHEDGTRFSLENISDTPQKHRFGPMGLSGMSGGGIWIPFEDNSKGPISTPAGLLAGIQTSYSEGGRKKWLRGTRTKSLIKLIEKHYPGLIRTEAIPSRRGLSFVYSAKPVTS